MQITTRDRNLLALQSDLLGAWAVGVRNLLALSGDPLRVGKYEQLAKSVGDVDSNALIRLVTMLNAGHLAAGETLSTPTDFLVGAALNPARGRRAEDRRQGRRPAPASSRRNIVYDVARFATGSRRTWSPASWARLRCWLGSCRRAASRPWSTCIRTSPAWRSTTPRSRSWRACRARTRKPPASRSPCTSSSRFASSPASRGVHIMAPGWEAEAITRVAGAMGQR